MPQRQCHPERKAERLEPNPSGHYAVPRHNGISYPHRYVCQTLFFTPFSAEIPPSLSLGAAYAVRLCAAVTRAPLRMTRRGRSAQKSALLSGRPRLFDRPRTFIQKSHPAPMPVKSGSFFLLSGAADTMYRGSFYLLLKIFKQVAVEEIDYRYLQPVANFLDR